MKSVAKTEGEETILTPDDAVRFAMEMHRTRRFEQAEQLYRMTLEAAPEHPDALHWLGVLMFDLDRPTEGRALIERSVELVPNHPDFHNNLGNALQACEEFTAAARAYRRCLPRHFLAACTGEAVPERTSNEAVHRRRPIARNAR